MASGNRSVEKTSFMDLYNRAVDLHVKEGCSFEIAWRVVSREFDAQFKQAYRCSSKSSQKSSSPGDQEEDSSFSGQLERESSSPAAPTTPTEQEDKENSPTEAPTTLTQQDNHQSVGQVMKNVILRFTYELFCYVNKMN